MVQNLCLMQMQILIIFANTIFTGSTATITLTVTSHWGNFSKINGRTTTDNSQQRIFSGDKGMEFSALTVKDIKWGRV